MHILAGVGCGVALGVLVGVAAFWWEMEHADGNLFNNF